MVDKNMITAAILSLVDAVISKQVRVKTYSRYGSGL